MLLVRELVSEMIVRGIGEVGSPSKKTESFGREAKSGRSCYVTIHEVT